MDDISGEHLETSRVKEARKTEIEFVEGMKVWKAVPRTKDMKVISTRWVDINKGDRANPNYRSRLVARELKKDTLSELFAAMPPLAALKVLLSLAVTKFKPNEKGVLCEDPGQEVLGFLDVKRAHFCSAATREIFVELPAEAGYPEGMVGKLPRSMYGCRDAGLNWEMCVVKAMKKLGFIQGASSPCVLSPHEGDQNSRTRRRFHIVGQNGGCQVAPW